MIFTAKQAGNKLTGADAHAWVEVYFDGVGWLPLDVTPGYYYDAVSLQQMIGMPEQASKNAALEDPSFEANQVASGYSLSWDLEIGRILDYEWMHRKFARADQQKKVRIYTHLYRRNAEIAGLSRNIYEPWMENR